MKLLYLTVDKTGAKKRQVVTIKDLTQAKLLFYDALKEDKKVVFIEKLENPSPEEQKNKIESKIIIYQ